MISCQILFGGPMAMVVITDGVALIGFTVRVPFPGEAHLDDAAAREAVFTPTYARGPMCRAACSDKAEQLQKAGDAFSRAPIDRRRLPAGAAEHRRRRCGSRTLMF